MTRSRRCFLGHIDRALPCAAPANLLQTSLDLGGALWPAAGLALEGGEYDVVELGVDARGPRGRLHHASGHVAREHLVEDHAQGEQIGAVVHLARTLQLLGRHVAEGAHRLMRASELNPAVLATQLREAEVHQLHAAELVEEHVLGLDVPVNDAAIVGVLQRFAEGRNDGERLLLWKSPLVEHLAEIGAVDEFHDDPGEALRLAEVVDGDDPGVHEASQGLELLAGSVRPAHHLRRRGQEDLDGDLAVEVDLAGAEHGTHAAAAEASASS